MAKKRYYEARAMEAISSSMIPSSRGIANMPQMVVYKQYPRVSYNGYEGLNDTMKGVDYQMRDDLKFKKMGSFPEKF